jgi:transposase-like protein
MGRRQFTREFKIEAARLVRERGVSVAQVPNRLPPEEAAQLRSEFAEEMKRIEAA